MLQAEEIDEVVDHYPVECRGCGHEFAEAERVPRAGAGRHQVAELPPIAVTYTEHRTHRLRCPDCKQRTRAVSMACLASRRSGPGCRPRSWR